MDITVVIVEDNPESMAHFIDAIQSQEHFSLLGTAVNGAEAFALIDRQPADVFLIDLGLPDVQGVDVIRYALKTHPGSEVIVVSIFDDAEHVIKSIEAGATGYVLKGNPQPEIIDAIRMLRNGGSPVSPAIARTLLKKFHLDGQTNTHMLLDPTRLHPTSSSPTQLVDQPKPHLTKREGEILHALAKGLGFIEIGESFSISTHTVARHVKHIYRKLAVHSRGEAVFEARKTGLLHD